MKPFTTSVLALIFVLAACGSDASNDPTTTIAGHTTTTPTTTSSTLGTTIAVPDPTSTTSTTRTDELGELLLGSWLDTAYGVVLRFADDGNHYVSAPRAEPFEFGPYTLDGNRLTLIADGGPDPVCVGSGPGVFDIEISSDGIHLRATAVSDSCALRADSLETGLVRFNE